MSSYGGGADWTTMMKQASIVCTAQLPYGEVGRCCRAVTDPRLYVSTGYIDMRSPDPMARANASTMEGGG